MAKKGATVKFKTYTKINTAIMIYADFESKL